MKQFFTHLAFVSSLLLMVPSSFAQYNEYIKNQVKKIEDEVKASVALPRDFIVDSVEAIKRKSNLEVAPNYYSEVFVHITDEGNYTVSLEDQLMVNPSGYYRFFDLYPGRVNISIWKDNQLIYKAQSYVRENQRIYLEFSEERGLFLVNRVPIELKSQWINFGQPIRQTIQPQYGVMPPPMDDESFQKFYKHVEENYHFSDDIIEFLTMDTGNASFTAKQIAQLVGLMSLSSEDILARKLYTRCVDPANYYLVFEKMTFNRDIDKVKDYIRQLNYR